ncbi:hypothetical protein [Jidongwangia harbinensis]|uniref:hypothetical protein n=1 Tax=Jidongwangia harbinensis TaxID=2878561 RepID=UPI001CDA3B17|nr:hypothetical protein [Jidongwangia harbinensis]MCA2214551.1 hypothetical protein [Jidongwangia harbinensis]
MDRLDPLLETAGPLLRRVDQVLSAGGAPADHEVWRHLRRVRLLPWEAVQAVAALRPGDLADAAAELRAGARSCARVAASLPPPAEWTGDAADAYDAARRRAAAHLSGGPDNLDGRLEATAALAEAMFDWMTAARDGLAAVLAEVLTSAEALSLSADADVDAGLPSAGDLAAAADVAARVLETIATSYAAAQEVATVSADLAVALDA